MKQSVLKMGLQTKLALIISSLRPVLPGCGNLVAPSGISAPPSYYGQGATYSGQAPTTANTNPSNYLCPSYANIKPQSGNNDPNSFNYYKLCPDRMSSSSTHFMITETSLNPVSNQTVCVFAAHQRVLSANLATPQISVQWVSEPGSPNTPLYRCADLSRTSAFLTFPDSGLEVQWNAAWIVAKGSETLMAQCLSNSKVACPAFSYGIF